MALWPIVYGGMQTLDMGHIKWLGPQVSEFQNIFFRTGLKLLEKNVFHAAKETTVTRR